MMTLIVTLCLLSKPTDCHDLKMPIADSTPQQCLMLAQTAAAENVNTQVEQVARYRCTRKS